MRVDTLTVELDSTTPTGQVDRTFTNAQYFPTWNGINVVDQHGAVEFFDNIEIVSWNAYTAATGPKE
jgi:hypothetical protein